MTEEDTFRALKRPSFAEMQNLFVEWFQSDVDIFWNEILESKHWTRDEWSKETLGFHDD